jgi:hypothetical protein
MRRFKRIYNFAVLGALGGLLGAALHQWVLLGVLASPLGTGQRRFYNALLGLLIGIAIGFFPRFAEAMSHYSFGQAVRSGMMGALLGGMGGAFAVLAGEVLHAQLGGHVAGRATAFALLGLMIGLAEGVAGGALWWRGVAGGVLGGIIAGALVEQLLKLDPKPSDVAILALLLMGLFISLFVSIFTNVLLDAWLEGLPGSKVAGHIYQLSKFHEPHEPAILGADKAGKVFIWIPGAEQLHASIQLTHEGGVLRHMAKGKETRVNGSPVGEQLLRDGDEIEIGDAKLLYRERRGGDAPAPVVTGRRETAQAPKRIKVLTKSV